MLKPDIQYTSYGCYLDLRNNTDQLTNIQQVMGPARFLCAIVS
ncbi:hypothetical protein T4D_653 [Trichinella pseudospiralis]|uniref:Uncharacterized protein n=1 Tax=Trichinella pseudospiralis TaxID=6337 RepID=A0A0V1DQV9_TRIPS|nr:hypothetical protein T4D_653 [Trichinella pseudospiralis]